MSARRLFTLLSYVPPEGAVGVRLKRLEAQTWRQDTELLALLCELMDVQTRTLIMVNSDKKKKPKLKELKIPRPWDAAKKRKKRKPTSDDLVRFFGKPESDSEHSSTST